MIERPKGCAFDNLSNPPPSKIRCHCHFCSFSFTRHASGQHASAFESHDCGQYFPTATAASTSIHGSRDCGIMYPPMQNSSTVPPAPFPPRRLETRILQPAIAIAPTATARATASFQLPSTTVDCVPSGGLRFIGMRASGQAHNQCQSTESKDRQCQRLWLCCDSQASSPAPRHECVDEVPVGQALSLHCHDCGSELAPQWPLAPSWRFGRYFSLLAQRSLNLSGERLLLLLVNTQSG